MFDYSLFPIFIHTNIWRYFFYVKHFFPFQGNAGSVAQGLIWGIMALGVYLTYKILNFADLTVDGSLATGGAVAVMLILNGCPPAAALAVSFAAGVLAGLITAFLHTALGIS